MKQQQLTKESKIRDLYQTPIGRDVIDKLFLQMNINKRLLKSPLILNLSVKTVERLLKKKLGSDFFDVLLNLFNQDLEMSDTVSEPQTKEWFKEAVFYQIYPRSFCDSNGDGIGDLKGIISKLDYLEMLGVDVIWLSPIYDSPNDDNGYDIRDYFKILAEFGTMDDFDVLLKELEARGMKIIMDLVVNHTSDEHEWYKKAIEDVNSPYHDYYHFEKSDNNQPPNNWTSFFSGSAWNYVQKNDEWSLHLFSKKQVDLNWECAAMRLEIIEMIKWWINKGVAGFRMDVINYISKQEGLSNGNEVIGELMGYYGIEHYFYGPKLHEYLQEIRQKAFDPFQAFSVGEMPGIGIQMGKRLCAPDRGELDMFFSFDHLENPGFERFDSYQYDLNYYKEYLINWTNNYANTCWMSLFYNNHDNPRFISKINVNPELSDHLAKMLATIQLTSKGTPFIFQGDELGAIDQAFDSIDDLCDIESINLYDEYLKTMSPESAFKKILQGSRDHARVPMNWDETLHGNGFSSGEAWIKNFDKRQARDAAYQTTHEDSVFNHYRKLIKIRKENDVLIYGDVKFLFEKKRDYFVYERVCKDDIFVIECNLSKKVLKRLLNVSNLKLISSNYQSTSASLRAYEANVYKKQSY